MAVYELAMFPLGTVLFPSLFLPLHVFEPRYQAMVDHCLGSTREFGVVLIERGSEVGGGDVRSSVGTVAEIVDARPLEAGRWALATVGSRRIRVAEWLDDRPYPRAMVEDWPDDTTSDEPGKDDLADVIRALRRVLGLRAELGEASAPATVELSDDPVLASYQVSALGPLGPADQQRMLEATTASERIGLLSALLADEREYLIGRLGMG